MLNCIILYTLTHVADSRWGTNTGPDFLLIDNNKTNRAVYFIQLSLVYIHCSFALIVNSVLGQLSGITVNI